MAAGVLVAKVRLAHKSGIPADADIIDFTFESDGVDPEADATALDGPLVDFFNLPPSPFADHVGHWLSACLSESAGASRIDWFFTDDLTGATPLGPPIHVHAWTLNTEGVGLVPMPNEVAVVNSIHGDLTGIPEVDGATRPRARRRGRQYIGPLADNASSNLAVTYEPQPTPGFVNVLVAASGDLALAAAADTAWCVWSRADAATYPVVGGWVDNAFDTMRSRGDQPTVRSSW